MLRDLLGPDIALLCRELGKPATSDLVDPSTDMVQALNRFLDWFVMARQMMIPVADVPELQCLALTMKEELQRVFPEKSGDPQEIRQKIGQTLEFSEGTRSRSHWK